MALGRRAGSESRRQEVKSLERVGSSLLNCGGGNPHIIWKAIEIH